MYINYSFNQTCVLHINQIRGINCTRLMAVIYMYMTFQFSIIHVHYYYSAQRTTEFIELNWTAWSVCSICHMDMALLTSISRALYWRVAAAPSICSHHQNFT